MQHTGEAEILVLRHQLNVLKRQAPKRPNLRNLDRLLFVWLSRLVPTTLGALKVAGPETVIRWQRAGFRAYWRFKSRVRAGRPKTPLEIRQLIRNVSIANPLWGAPRIHGELAKHRRPPSQRWRTSLRNHADGIASMDLFVVPTISFQLLYGLLILQHGRRQILWLGVTAHPTADWIAQQ